MSCAGSLTDRMPMYCTACGAPLSSESTGFCGSCGQPVDPGSSNRAGRPETADAASKGQPSYVPTIVVTFFFGLFGLIPAVRRVRRSHSASQSAVRSKPRMVATSTYFLTDLGRAVSKCPLPRAGSPPCRVHRVPSAWSPPTVFRTSTRMVRGQLTDRGHQAWEEVLPPRRVRHLLLASRWVIFRKPIDGADEPVATPGAH